MWRFEVGPDRGGNPTWWLYAGNNKQRRPLRTTSATTPAVPADWPPRPRFTGTNDGRPRTELVAFAAGRHST